MSITNALDGRLYVRISSADKRALSDLARRRGLTLSRLLREGAEALATKSAAA